MAYGEGQRLQGSDGQVYVVHGGVPVLESTAPVGPVTLGMPKPGYQYEGPKAAADLAGKTLDNASTIASTNKTVLTTPADVRKANADADKAVLEAQQAQMAAANKPDPAQARIQSQLQTDDVLTSIQRARDQINGGWSTGIPGAILGHIPGTAASDLGGTLSTIGSNVTQGVLANLKAQSAQGASGFGALSDSEGRLLRDSVASLGQNQSSDQLLHSLSMVERHYRNSLAFQNKEDPRDPAVAAKYGIALPTMKPVDLGGGGPTPPAQGPDMGLSGGGYESGADPTLKGVNSHVASLIASGKSTAEVRAYLESIKPGLGAAPNIDAWVKFHAQNPSRPIGVNLEEQRIPLSPMRGAVSTAAQSAPGAALMAAGDMLTGGYMDNLTSNPGLARAGMSAVAGEHPYANFAGQIGGGMLAGALSEAAAARIGFTGVGAMRAADAGYGSLYGSGSADDGSRVGGALTGGIAGLGGGMFGRGLARTAGRATAGIQDAGKRALINSGIPLTMGQALGGSAKGLEDRFAGFPGVGDLVNARRKEGMTAFQNRAFDEALLPIGGSTKGALAENGVASGLRQVGDAYDKALSGVNVTTDAPYKATNGALAARIGAIPRVGPEVLSALDATVSPMFQNGSLSGQSMQAVDRGLHQVRNGYSSDPLFATHIAPAIDAVGDNMRGLFQRQAPDVLPAYDAAKGAYRNMSVLADTVNAGVNTGGEFTAAQLGQQARKNAIKFGGRNAAASGDRPFALLQRAAQEVLPSKVPDSGTAGRLALPTIAAGVGGLTGYGAGKDDEKGSTAALSALTLGSLAAVPYTKTAQAALSRTLLAERSPAAIAVGNIVNQNPRLAGMFGSQLALRRYTGQ